MISRPLQFAITREDPSLERELIAGVRAPKILLVCSAGDTILSLLHHVPDAEITTFDFNHAQLEHFIHKARGGQSMDELCALGNFESLFRQWSHFFYEFILSRDQILEIFLHADRFPDEIFASRYWPVSFDLHFHDTFLRAMFGDAAIQHAPKGSYPRYFQRAFEKGLKQKTFSKNPFLQHIFFGKFLELPAYLKAPSPIGGVKLIHGTLRDCGDLSRFDLIQLSNIFDWSSMDEIRSSCELLRAMKPGAKLLVRQINNETSLPEFLGPEFSVDIPLSERLQEIDLSLFYIRVVAATKTR